MGVKAKLAAAVVGAFVVSTMGPTMAAAASDDGYVPLAGTAPSWAAPSQNGTVSPRDLRAGQQTKATMRVQVWLPQRHRAKLAKLASAFADPDSPQYGRSVSLSTYQKEFAPTKSSVAKVEKYLAKQGLKNATVLPHRAAIQVTAPSTRVAKAFRTPIKRVSNHGKKIVTATKNARVKSSIAPLISTITGLTQNPVHTMRVSKHVDRNGKSQPSAAKPPKQGTQYWKQAKPKGKKAKFDHQSRILSGYRPADIKKIYGIPTKLQKKSPTLGIVDAYDGINTVPQTKDGVKGDKKQTMKDTRKYFKGLGLKPPKWDQYVDHTPAKVKANSGWYGEQILDVQSSFAVAPNATIHYWGAPAAYNADLDTALYQAIVSGEVTTVSNSYGDIEANESKAENRTFNMIGQTASVLGVSIFASSGDDGDYSALGYKPMASSAPANSPWVTSVGGTSVGLNKHGKTVVRTGWEDDQSSNGKKKNATFVFGAGGGLSTLNKAPGYQYMVTDVKQLAIPTAAALADPYTGFLDYQTGNYKKQTGKYESWGGTSLASPLLAAMVGLAKVKHHSHWGLANPRLFQLYKTKALSDPRQYNAAEWGHAADGSLAYIAFDRGLQTLQSTVGFDNVTGVGAPHGRKFFKLMS
ncbi:S53 family peptidase [Spelaeicoccus albus]|uniref:Subtilase family serine protease n=2 Tax=Spelaeicoccus albus TaxID=1280376 RepID=A0A7Z0AC09_9MICO|nr:subtilase family serine protease [Spelaeicoccus albus]